LWKTHVIHDVGKSPHQGFLDIQYRDGKAVRSGLNNLQGSCNSSPKRLGNYWAAFGIPALSLEELRFRLGLK
jgi:hypothetical protein